MSEISKLRSKLKVILKVNQTGHYPNIRIQVKIIDNRSYPFKLIKWNARSRLLREDASHFSFITKLSDNDEHMRK